MEVSIYIYRDVDANTSEYVHCKIDALCMFRLLVFGLHFVLMSPHEMWAIDASFSAGASIPCLDVHVSIHELLICLAVAMRNLCLL